MLLSACKVLAGNSSAPIPIPEEQRFNFVVGTQTIGPVYQFTQEPRLVETAKAIQEMGSNILKFSMTNPDKNGGGAYKNINSLVQLARFDSATKKVLDMPFAYYVIWAYPFTTVNWRLSFSPSQAASEYREMYDLTCYLLSAYSGSGKTFYLGHWEGDWGLFGLGHDRLETDVPIENMVAWLNTRQKAIDDAKRDTPHQNVQVYHYTEVNLVKKAMRGDKTVTNSVLPRTNVDFVSYSAWDNEFDNHLIAALDYIESKLPPKTSIRGKRVFVGEYGFPTRWGFTPEQQDKLSRKVMTDALKWGAPFALYWELYNNGVDENGQLGYWLIDDKGVKQPVYYTHQHLYEKGKAFVAGYRKKNGRLPTEQEYRDFARAWLQTNTP